MGKACWNNKLVRSKSNKLFITRSVLKREHFLDFASGAAYAISYVFASCVVSKLRNISQIPLEDVSIGLIAEDCKIPLYDLETELNCMIMNTVDQEKIFSHDIV